MSGKVRGAILTLLAVGVLAISPFRPLKISGKSMEPTLHSGQTYLLDHLYWRLGGLRRNDIVVIDHGSENWVKRLIGLPGDVLQIERSPGGWIIYVANVTANPAVRRTNDELEEIQVGPDEIFVIGDNLNRSADSTNQEAGSFRIGDVIGVVRTFTFRRQFEFPGPRRPTSAT